MQTQNTPPSRSPSSLQKPQPPQGNNLGQLFISVLQESVRQQPVKPVQPSTWLDERLGLPSNAEDILWRISWLFAVPAVISLILVPVAQWLWLNGYPIVVMLVGATSALVYWALWMVALATPCQTPKNLIRLQLSAPVLTIWFVIVWEVMTCG
jgi:hypothetical protein